MRFWIRNLFTRPATCTIRKATRRARLILEVLEDRTVPSTFTVLNTNDTGMIGVTLFGLFLTPVFYFVVRWLVERKAPRHHEGGNGNEVD